MSAGKSIRAPKGTRDLYPDDMLRRRYITRTWRDVSIRCGFDEIDGPTFETADLYAVKSGEGILGELFQAYSGKSPEEVEQVQASGRAPFAMRPEFTPTLARMYAAKASSLPKPTKWFTGGPYFRAERPQRGRLREFLQWNCDFIGDDGSPTSRAQADAECLACSLGILQAFGFTADDMQASVSDRASIEQLLTDLGLNPDQVASVFALLDRRAKTDPARFAEEASALGLDIEAFDRGCKGLSASALGGELGDALRGAGLTDWVRADYSIVRGLAYYTGTVFEILRSGERAVAGGGRYDRLIALFGAPDTPAVGIAMGDVVLGVLLDEAGLMPEGKDLLDALSLPAASVRPEVLCLPGGDPEAEAPTRRLAADLRRGIESKAHQDKDDAKPWDRHRYDASTDGVRPMHARTTYKSTRNLKKLLQDAEKQFARFAAVVHEPGKVQLKDLDTRTDLTPNDVPGLPGDVADFSVDPASPVYIGRAAHALLG